MSTYFDISVYLGQQCLLHQGQGIIKKAVPTYTPIYIFLRFTPHEYKLTPTIFKQIWPNIKRLISYASNHVI